MTGVTPALPEAGATLALMQPYLLPYVGYFALVAATDHFVAFDAPQYIKGGWINRNRVLHPEQGWRYIGVPVAKAPHDTPIRDARIATGRWKRRILGQLDHYRRFAPFYDQVVVLLDEALDESATHIGPLAVGALRVVCRYLELHLSCTTWSELDLDIRPARHAGDWSLALCEATGAAGYVNPIGGRDLFQPDDFAAAGVDLAFLQMRPAAYAQAPGRPFEPWLSIVDVLMFNTPAQARALVRGFDLVRPGSEAPRAGRSP